MKKIIKNKTVRKKRAKKSSAVLTYEQVYRIPVRVLIPIKVLKSAPRAEKKQQAGIFGWNIFKQIAKIGSSVFLIFGLLLQALPLIAFEAHIINVTARICSYSETRTMGYWKNHPEDYDPALLTQFLGDSPSDEVIDSQDDVNAVFDANNSIMRNKLKKQLLAMKFNIEAFGIGGYIDPNANGKTLDEIVGQADNLLRDLSTTNSVLEQMKDLLDDINNLHQINVCGNSQLVDENISESVNTSLIIPEQTILIQEENTENASTTPTEEENSGKKLNKKDKSADEETATSTEQVMSEVASSSQETIELPSSAGAVINEIFELAEEKTAAVQEEFDQIVAEETIIGESLPVEESVPVTVEEQTSADDGSGSESQDTQISPEQPAVEQEPVITPESSPTPDSAPPEASSGSGDGSGGDSGDVSGGGPPV